MCRPTPTQRAIIGEKRDDGVIGDPRHRQRNDVGQRRLILERRVEELARLGEKLPLRTRERFSIAVWRNATLAHESTRLTCDRGGRTTESPSATRGPASAPSRRVPATFAATSGISRGARRNAPYGENPRVARQERARPFDARRQAGRSARGLSRATSRTLRRPFRIVS
jgi:hypothetical protein